MYKTQVSHIAGGFFTSWATREAQEDWSGWPIPSAVDLPNPGIELGSPALQADSLPAELPGKPEYKMLPLNKYKIIPNLILKFCVLKNHPNCKLISCPDQIFFLRSEISALSSQMSLSLTSKPLTQGHLSIMGIALYTVILVFFGSY